jgi:hypothetical protein
MQVETRIGARRGVANEVLLPGSRDEVHCCDLVASKQAPREIDGMPLHARELTGGRCERDNNLHASTSD